MYPPPHCGFQPFPTLLKVETGKRQTKNIKKYKKKTKNTKKIKKDKKYKKRQTIPGLSIINRA
jgi:hypothetical protein